MRLSTSIARCAATAPRRASSTPCRRARSSTNFSATTRTKRSSTPCLRGRSDGTRINGSTPPQVHVMTTEATAPAGPKPKKSVALSGVMAGNTALCTVGRTGNDLHYRGYDILAIADSCEFEEIAHLLVHGTLPTLTELREYKNRLRALRGIPAPVRETLERIPAAA